MDEILGRVGRAADVMMELYPFLLYRLAVYGAFGLVMCAYWIGALLLCGLAYKLWEIAGTILFLIALAGNFGLVYIARSYFLYMVKAGYIAVLTHSITEGNLPAGVTQTEFAKQKVTARFKEASVMSAVDALVKGVIRAFNGTLEEISSWLPIPGLNQVVGFVQQIIRLAAGTIDEAVLSLVFQRKDQNVWDSAREGLQLYAMNWKPILKVAAVLVILDWVGTALTFIVLLVAMGLPAIALIPGHWSTIRAMAVIIPVVSTYVLRVAIIEPLALTAVLITFHQVIKGQKVDPTWDARLESISSQYKELKTRAARA